MNDIVEKIIKKAKNTNVEVFLDDIRRNSVTYEKDRLKYNITGNTIILQIKTTFDDYDCITDNYNRASYFIATEDTAVIQR